MPEPQYQDFPSPLRTEGSAAGSAATWQSWGEGFSASSNHSVPTSHRTPHPPLRDDLSPQGRGELAPNTHSATGAHSTASILGAAVASITSRSKPSATPLAAGISASAARKSSSSG